MRAGDRVELRNAVEILATLDEEGRLEGVPFMPEMLAYFGRRFTVSARVERACDTIHYRGVLRLKDTVILDDERCDGSGHDGCQAQCRLYWKEAWLRPASAPSAQESEPTASELAELRRRARAGARIMSSTTADSSSSTVTEQTYRCQATELLQAGESVSWYDLHSFVGELRGGNVGLWRWLCVMVRIVLHELGLRVGLTTRHFSPFRPRELGEASAVSPPRGLEVGQLVQIRPKNEIRTTLGPNGKNRGLSFDKEMVPYCGRTARVKAKVERFIDESTGRMVELASDAYILDGVVCQSYRSDKRWFCPRAIYPWWREAWLEPAAKADAYGPNVELPASATPVGGARSRDAKRT